MFWVEEENPDIFTVPDDIIDVAFDIECKTLPVDHVQSLFDAVSAVLPWLADEARAGLHAIHGAETGNGWARPEHADDLIYLSRRTKLILRIPSERLEDARKLSGHRLDVDGNSLVVGAGKPRLLGKTETLYARYVVTSDEALGEEAFLDAVIGELKSLDLRFKKVLCGREHTLRLGGAQRTARSLMVADLPYSDAVRLQELGLGQHRNQGCGLFIPHKSV